MEKDPFENAISGGTPEGKDLAIDQTLDIARKWNRKISDQNLSEAVQWCITSCMRQEKLYGIDACFISFNDIRKPENKYNEI